MNSLWIRDDPETTSAPDPKLLDDDEQSVFEFIKANEDEHEYGVSKEAVAEFIESELEKYDWDADEILRKLDRGFVYQRYSRGYRAAK